MAYPPLPVDDLHAKFVSIAFSHGVLTANTSAKLWKAPAGKRFVVDRILYINPTGLPGDATNAFRGEVKTGATLLVELFNTDTNDDPAGVTLPIDTFLEFDASELASRLVAAGDEVSLVYTEDGTATLPAGSGYLEGYLV